MLAFTTPLPFIARIFVHLRSADGHSNTNYSEHRSGQSRPSGSYVFFTATNRGRKNRHILALLMFWPSGFSPLLDATKAAPKFVPSLESGNLGNLCVDKESWETD